MNKYVIILVIPVVAILGFKLLTSSKKTTRISAMQPTTPINGFYNEYYFLSNFYDPAPTSRTVNGVTYTFRNSEAAFQASKYDDQPNVIKLFLNATPDQAKFLSKQYQYDYGQNAEQRINIMRQLLQSKFKQNPLLWAKLKATGNRLLIENNTWGDIFWGTSGTPPVGENNLGKLLMELRNNNIIL
jgi:ribA/ribD-fused uncharacterized protein